MQSANILLQPGVMPRLLQGLWVTIWLAAVSVASVSYTHLTLPTSDLV